MAIGQVAKNVEYICKVCAMFTEIRTWIYPSSAPISFSYSKLSTELPMTKRFFSVSREVSNV